MQSNIKPTDVLTALDSFIVIQQANGSFRSLSQIPDWFEAFLPGATAMQEFLPQQALVFLDHFIEDLTQHFQDPSKTIITSGPWSEADLNGNEHHFSAIATRIKGQVAVLIQRIDKNRLQHQAMLQKAREYSLNYEKLLKETDKKEILLHTIIHDLASPLNAIQGAIQLLTIMPKEQLTPEVQNEMLALALSACDQQNGMIQSILDAFSAELGSFDRAATDEASAPDIVECANHIGNLLSLTFKHQGVYLKIDSQLDSERSWKVIGETAHLQRVIANLLENALRYSPASSTVTLSMRLEEDCIVLSIDDQGPGVPTAQVDDLFQKFSGGKTFGGKAGLGLYFCRITIKKWGGTIGYTPGHEGGSCFWFKLPLMTKPAPK